MKPNAGSVIAAVSLALLGCTYTEQQGAAASAEVIVKFATEQPINTTIGEAFDDAGAEASLEKSVQELSGELGVPFEYSRLTSGREIVLKVPAGPVLNAIAERLRQSPAVKTFTVDANDILLITLERSGIDPDLLLDPEKLGFRIIGDKRFPVDCDIRADGKLAVTPNIERLVATLVEDLGRRSEIEYAQPNHQVRRFDTNQ